MKKITLLMSFLVLLSWQGYTQISSYYSFSESTATYTPITGGTVTTTITGNSDDGEELNVPIGFTFKHVTTNYTTLTIGVNGAISFTNADVSFTNNLAGTGANNTNIIAPLWDDLFHRTVDAAEISYVTTGVSPNQIFTIQWKNISWNTAGNTVNFQLVLYEGSNNIQFNYGASASVQTTRTASIGFNKGTTGTDFISVTPGTPATTSTAVANNSIPSANYPGNGKVYLFTYTPPACPAPSALTVANITTTSADLNWTENGSATMWDIEYGATPFTPTGVPTITGTTTKPHNLTGLAAQTSYAYYVRADCGVDSSAWVGPFSFYTGYCTPSSSSASTYVNNFSTTGGSANISSLATGFTTGGYFNGTAQAVVSYASGSFNFTTDIIGGSAGFSIWVDWNNNLVFDNLTEKVFNTTGYSNGPFVGVVTVPGATPLGNYRMRITTDYNASNPANPCAAASRAEFEDYTITVSAPPACPAPSALTVANITAASADLNWTENGSATMWDIEYGATPFTPTGVPTITGTTTKPHNLTGLAAQTSYAYYVRADCGVDSSAWVGPYTFTTACGVITPNYTQPFATFVPNSCWNEADAGNLFTGPTSIGASPWTAGTAIGNTAKINLYFNTISDWILTPYFDLTLGGYEVVVDVAVTDWNNAAADAMGADDSVRVVYTENNITWNTLLTFTAANNLPNSLTTFSALIPSTASNVRFGILATDGPVDNLEDYDFHIDNFIIRTPPACPAPTSLTATAVLSTSANLGWTENGSATTWDIEYGATPFTPIGVPTITGTTTNPHNLTGLTPNTTYAYYVRADCGGPTSVWSGPYTFTTACSAVIAPWNEGFENAGVIPSCWKQGVANAEAWRFSNTGTGNHIGNNGVMNGATTSGNYFAWVDDSSPHSLNTTLESPLVDVSALTSPELSFYLISNNEGYTNVGFSIDVWDGAAWNLGFYTHNTNTIAGAWEKIVVNLSTLTITGNIQFRFIVNETNGSDFYDDVAIDDVDVHEAPACPAPSALAATNITPSAVDLAWTENGSATMWDIEYGATPFTPTGVPTITGTTTNPHNLTGLTPNTTYAYYVRADCGVDSSAWVGPYTFTTACNPFAVPFVENFNSTSPTENCWTVINNNGDGDLWDMNYTLNPLNGDQVAIMYTDFNAGANDDYLVTPTLILTGNERLRFHYRVQSASEPNDFQVTLSTTGVGVGNFTNTLMPLTAVSNITYQEQIINLSAYTGNVNIAFHIPAGGLDGWRLYIDSVVVEAIPTCPDPIALTATNITATTADLAWTEMGSATTWDIEYGATPFTPTGVPTITGTTTNPHNLTGLTPNTTYAYYVRADCGVDSSAWVGPYSFTTACNTINTFPFLEDFEAASTTRSCWSQIQEIGTANWTFATGSSGGAITTAYSGTENARFVSMSGSNSPITKLVSPVFDLTSVAMPEIAFFYGQELWFSDQNELKVYYRTSTASAWVQLAHYTADVAVWTADTLTLPNPSATYQIAFEGINNYGRANVVDDFELYDAVSCSAPSNLTAANIQPTSALLDWTENGTATSWNIEWGVTTFVLGTGTPQAVAAKPYLLQGLMPMTTYDYYVQADCGNDSSTWVGPYTFSTPACMPIGLDLGADTTLCPDDTLTLDAGTGSYLYNWSTGAITQQISVDTNSLGGNGTYTISVTVIDLITGCTYQDNITVTFSPCAGINSALNNVNMNVYPNPNNGEFTLNINTTDINELDVKVLNTQGQVVYAKNNYSNVTNINDKIDLSNNANGIYFIVITTNKGIVTHKLVIQ
jgi:hypothetical protein